MMKIQRLLGIVALSGWLVSCGKSAAEPGALRDQPEAKVQTFTATGVVRELKADGRTVVVTPGPVDQAPGPVRQSVDVEVLGTLGKIRVEQE